MTRVRVTGSVVAVSGGVSTGQDALQFLVGAGSRAVQVTVGLGVDPAIAEEIISSIHGTELSARHVAGRRVLGDLAVLSKGSGGAQRAGHAGAVPPSDRLLDPVTAAQVVAAQFPDLDSRHAVGLGSGWDFDAFAIDGVVFRFPKRADTVAWLTREIGVLALVRPALGRLVPDISHVGEATGAFPRPFVGYPMLPGAPVGPTRSQGLAADLAAALTRLHRVDRRLVPPSPTGEESKRAGGHRVDLAPCAAALRARLPAQLRSCAEPYLSGRLPLPPQPGPGVLTHNDIRVEHVLAGGDGGLCGLIDWTDAMVADAALDVAGLITVGDWHFVAAVLDLYQPDIDDGLRSRAVWLARTMTLRWLGDAIEHGTDPAGPLTWAHRSLAPPPWGEARA